MIIKNQICRKFFTLEGNPFNFEGFLYRPALESGSRIDPRITDCNGLTSRSRVTDYGLRIEGLRFGRAQVLGNKTRVVRLGVGKGVRGGCSANYERCDGVRPTAQNSCSIFGQSLVVSSPNLIPPLASTLA